MSTLKEIAQYVGVSSASVSIYLNDNATNRISPRTKLKIDEAIKKFKYQRNMFARNLSTSKSNIIGIIFPTIVPMFMNDFTNPILSGVQSRLSANGYAMLFFPSFAGTSSEIAKRQLTASVGCDGYILFSTGFCSLQDILANVQELQNLQKPYVTLNIPELDLPINQVILKDLDSTLGIEYLLGKGFRQILLVLGREKDVHTRNMMKKIPNLLKQRGIPFDDRYVIYGNYTAEDSAKEFSRFLDMGIPVEAICCMSDIMAASITTAIKQSGLSVPEDISVMGRNNSLYSRISDPQLTTMDLHMFEAGQSAANLLFDSLAGGDAKQKVAIAGTIVERKSVPKAGRDSLASRIDHTFSLPACRRHWYSVV